jgi:p-aminobenzoyl-glutamate transporter AbgT
MFDHQHYVSILKWRQGEYQALFRLKDSVKNWITPLF